MTEKLPLNENMPSITEQRCVCPDCGWVGTVWDCEGDTVCEDCKLPYAEFGLDTVLSNEQWADIHPEGNEGILCANCIVKRISLLSNTIIVKMIVMKTDDYLVVKRELTKDKIEYGKELESLALEYLEEA